MSLVYNTDVGYGIRVKKNESKTDRPSGYVVEIHFYDKRKAVEFVDEIIRKSQEKA